MEPTKTTDFPPAGKPPERGFLLGPAFALWIITVLLYLPTGRFEFISFDDPLFVTHNEHVNQGFTAAGLKWAFTAADIDYWRPLSWISHMLDVELFGMNPGGHHLTSVFIHACNAVILFFVFLQFRLDRPASFFIAALFAWHPLHVESVAWIGERKDVLCAFFWFLGLLFYARYAQTASKRFYGLTLAAFGLGLMSKPMIVTLPFQLLLLDHWPLRRVGQLTDWKQLVMEKLPFLALTVLSSAFAYTAQVGVGEMAEGTVPGGGFRIGNALIAYSDYLQHTFWPAGLGVFYPYPESLPTADLAIAFLLVFIACYLAFIYAKDHPHVIIGWFFFVGTIVPVVGMLKVGGQASADRYTYVATTGLFWTVAILLFPAGKPVRSNAVVIAASILVALLCLSHRQISHWRNNITLFTHTVQVTDENWVMMNNLARAHLQDGNTSEARAIYEAALEIRPFQFAHYFLAQIHHAEGRASEAEQHYLAALKMEPDSIAINFRLAEFYWAMEMREAAVQYLQKVQQISPDHGDARRLMDEIRKTTSTTQ